MNVSAILEVHVRKHSSKCKYKKKEVEENEINTINQKSYRRPHI